MLRTRVTSAVLLTLGASFGFGSSLFAQADAHNPVVSYVYLGESIYNGENNTWTDQIAAFAVHKDGTAEAVPGSPFLGPSANVVADRRFVFATGDPRVSNQVYTFARNKDGSLVQVSSVDGAAHNDYPASSYVNGLYFDQTGSSLYVGEEGTGDEIGIGQYARFRVKGDGALKFRDNTQMSQNYVQLPLVFSTDNTLAYTADCSNETWSVSGFYVGQKGELTSFDPGAGNPIPYYCPMGDISLSSTGYLAVAGGVPATPFPFRPQFALYRVESTGKLDYLSTTVATGFHYAMSLEFDPTGRYLATGDDGLRVYKVNSDGSLAALPLVLPDAGVEKLSWDDDGHLFALEYDALHILSVQNGAVTEVGAPIAMRGNYSIAVVNVHKKHADTDNDGDNDGDDR
jgi:hypothetical protein